MPSHPDSKVPIDLPSNPVDAAQLLEYKLENEGYPLVSVIELDGYLKVVPGKIIEVEVLGLPESLSTLIHGYLDSLIGQSPTQDQLNHAIALVTDIPGLSAGVHLEPLGQFEYKAVLSGRMFKDSGIVSARNVPTRSLKNWDASVHYEAYSTWLGGDIFRLDGSITEAPGNNDGSGFQLGYEVPLNYDGLYGEWRLSQFKSSADNPSQAGQVLDIESTNFTFVLGSALRRYVDLADYIYAEVDYQTQDFGVFGSTDYGLMRGAFFESRHDIAGGTTSWSVTATYGENLDQSGLGFWSLGAGYGIIFWIPELFETAEMRIETSLLYSSEDTPGFELFSFSGTDRMRGFQPFEYSGNYGADLSVEIAETFQMTDSRMSVTPYAFVDATYLGNPSNQVGLGRPESNELVSLGLGSKVSFWGGLSLNAWLATAIYDEQTPGRENEAVFYVQGQYSWIR